MHNCFRLGIKTLIIFQANSSVSLNSEMVASGIVPLLVNIACQGTTFSSQWILRDLEASIAISNNHFFRAFYYKLQKSNIQLLKRSGLNTDWRTIAS